MSYNIRVEVDRNHEKNVQKEIIKHFFSENDTRNLLDLGSDYLIYNFGFKEEVNRENCKEKLRKIKWVRLIEAYNHKLRTK